MSIPSPKSVCLYGLLVADLFEWPKLGFLADHRAKLPAVSKRD
ncbi:MAG: hypothetical protein ACI8W8_000742 [Rhodothermales bacterium]|jgi:hypothetical protein